MFPRDAKNTLSQLSRYALVGGVAFFVDYGTLWSLKELCGINYLASAAIAFIFGLLVNYAISIHWVFAHHQSTNCICELLVFLLTGLIGLLINEITIFSSCSILGLHYMLAKLISTGIVFLWNFFSRKYFLFIINRNQA